jgi:hypothetical protein
MGYSWLFPIGGCFVTSNALSKGISGTIGDALLMLRSESENRNISADTVIN